MDKNQDGVISEEEFLEGCEKVTHLACVSSILKIKDKKKILISLCLFVGLFFVFFFFQCDMWFHGARFQSKSEHLLSDHEN